MWLRDTKWSGKVGSRNIMVKVKLTLYLGNVKSYKLCGEDCWDIRQSDKRRSMSHKKIVLKFSPTGIDTVSHIIERKGLILYKCTVDVSVQSGSRNYVTNKTDLLTGFLFRSIGLISNFSGQLGRRYAMLTTTRRLRWNSYDL